MYRWPTFVASPERVEYAKQLHDARYEAFGRYSNYVADHGDQDDRWVGDLGEAALDLWLKRKGETEYIWIQENVTRSPDFIVRGESVDVKTATRRAPVQPHYSVELGFHHTIDTKKRDWYFFASYQIQERRVWLLGAVSHDDLPTKATYHPTGSIIINSDNPNVKPFVVRDKMGLYSLRISDLDFPEDWLSILKCF